MRTKQESFTKDRFWIINKSNTPSFFSSKASRSTGLGGLEGIWCQIYEHHTTKALSKKRLKRILKSAAHFTSAHIRCRPARSTSAHDFCARHNDAASSARSTSAHAFRARHNGVASSARSTSVHGAQGLPPDNRKASSTRYSMEQSGRHPGTPMLLGTAPTSKAVLGGRQLK